MRFDTAHKDAVYTALLMHNREDTLFSTLPKEVLLQELLPHLPYGSFPRAAASGRRRRSFLLLLQPNHADKPGYAHAFDARAALSLLACVSRLGS